MDYVIILDSPVVQSRDKNFVFSRAGIVSLTALTVKRAFTHTRLALGHSQVLELMRLLCGVRRRYRKHKKRTWHTQTHRHYTLSGNRFVCSFAYWCTLHRRKTCNIRLGLSANFPRYSVIMIRYHAMQTGMAEYLPLRVSQSQFAKAR